jgi:hypothetical protein
MNDNKKVFTEWDKYPDKNYLAVDKSGKGFLYKDEPKRFTSVWGPATLDKPVGDFDATDWQNSLQKRPS